MPHVLTSHRFWTRFVALAGFAFGVVACGALLDLPDPGLTPDGDAASGTDEAAAVSGDAQSDASGGDGGGALADAEVSTTPLQLTSNHNPWGIAVDDAYVYWIDDHTNVGRVSKSGGAPMVLATGSVAYGTSIVADGRYTYFTGLDGIYACARDGCNNTPTAIYTNASSAPYIIANDDTYIYYAIDEPRSVGRVEKSGGSGQQLATLPATVDGMLIQGGFIYLSLDNLPLAKVPVGGGAVVTVLAPDAGGEWTPGLTIQAGHFYLTQTSVGQVDVMKSDGTLSAIAINQHSPTFMVGDGASLYWVANGATDVASGQIVRCALTECIPTPLAGEQSDPRQLAVDDRAVYWVNHDNGSGHGGVMKVRK